MVRDKGPYKRVYRKTGNQLHPLYDTWLSMKTRCYNPNHQAYHSYGGKGIYVCERWLASFEDFANDMGPRPTGATLDRIQGHLGYTPENCRWADKLTQARNRSDWSTKTLVLVHGVLIGIRDAADFLGITYSVAYKEFNRSGNLDKYVISLEAR